MGEPIEKFVKPVELKNKVQGFVPSKLYEEVNRYREKKGWTWHELLEAMFKRLVSEIKD